jgi:hypothetical protein
MSRRYPQNSMLRLGAAVLRSTSTAVTAVTQLPTRETAGGVHA